VHAISSAAAVVLREILAAQPDTPSKVSCAWQIAAGPAMGRAATVEWRATGELRVRARSDTWRQEIARASPLLLGRLAHLLGPDVVRSIAVDRS
jgi:hypothetical protein